MGLFDKFSKPPNIEKMKKNKDVKGLIKALKHKDLRVREGAAIVLGEIGDTRAVEPLTQALKNEDDIVQQQAATALGKIGDLRAVEPLIQALNDKSTYVRERTSWALGELRDARSVEPLTQTLKDEDLSVRVAAACVLGEIGDARAVEPLAQTLKDKSIGSRVTVEALEKLGWKPRGDIEKAHYLTAKNKWDELLRLGKPAVAPIIQGLKDKDEDARLKALSILEKIGGKRAVEPLIAALEYHPHARVRWEAASDLGKIGDAKAVEPLINALKHDDIDYVSAEAARALGKIGDAKAVEALVETWKKDERHSVPSEEVQLLYPTDHPRQQSVFMRQEAAEALVKIGEPAVERLIKILKDPSIHRDDRGVAAEALCMFDDARVVEALIEALKGDIMRESAIKALGERGDARAFEPLIQMALKDEYPSYIRVQAVSALGKLGDARAVEPLIQVLKDESFSVQEAAAEAMGKIGDVRAVEPLTQALKDKHVLVQRAAKEALDKIRAKRS